MVKGKMKGTWFHNKASILIGILFTAYLIVNGIAVWVGTIHESNYWFAGIFIILYGLVMLIHLIRNYVYYVKHRIVKIEKTDKRRIIIKE